MNNTKEDNKVLYDHLLGSMYNLRKAIDEDTLSQLEVNAIALVIASILRNTK